MQEQQRPGASGRDRLDSEVCSASGPKKRGHAGIGRTRHCRSNKQQGRQAELCRRHKILGNVVAKPTANVVATQLCRDGMALQLDLEARPGQAGLEERSDAEAAALRAWT